MPVASSKGMQEAKHRFDLMIAAEWFVLVFEVLSSDSALHHTTTVL